MKIIIVCYPTYGGSGVLATELGHKLAKKDHEIHFIAYQKPGPSWKTWEKPWKNLLERPPRIHMRREDP